MCLINIHADVNNLKNSNILHRIKRKKAEEILLIHWDDKTD